MPNVGVRRLLAIVITLAAAAAFARDLAERATTSQAAVTAAIEAVAVVGCFLVFGRSLGLWRERDPRP